MMAINDPVALLRRLAAESEESGWLEFKHNNCTPEEIGKYVSACANAAMLLERDRAYIVFGVDDSSKNLIGTDVKLKKKKMGGENLENWLNRVITPSLNMELIDFLFEEKNFSIISVEPTYDRPVQFQKIEYIRIGENIKSLKDFPEHERALWLATGRRKFESAIALTHQTEEEVLSRLEVESYYELKEENKPRSNISIIRKLIQCGFILDDMEGGYQITNLGALLFSKNIKDFPSVARKAIRVIEYSGRDKSSQADEKIGTKGYAVGFSALLDYIYSKLPSEEIFEKGVRRRKLKYSRKAIREIIANALIHQDLTTFGSGPVVEIYQDRIEVSNPGNSLIEIDRIIDERRSRNEQLAETMRDLGICEERGGGIDKAIIEIEEMFLPAPEFHASEKSMTVVLYGPKKFSDLSKSEKIWACFCHSVVRWLRRDYMSNSSLRERFGLQQQDYQMVSGVISDAKREGRIAPADPDQGNRYAKYIPYWAAE